jgi:hypothetical protein
MAKHVVLPHIKQREPSPAHLPGLEATQGPNARPPAYINVHFGGTREYKDDEDGFVVVSYGRRQKARRNWRGKDKKAKKMENTV